MNSTSKFQIGPPHLPAANSSGLMPSPKIITETSSSLASNEYSQKLKTTTKEEIPPLRRWKRRKQKDGTDMHDAHKKTNLPTTDLHRALALNCLLNMDCTSEDDHTPGKAADLILTRSRDNDEVSLEKFLEQFSEQFVINEVPKSLNNTSEDDDDDWSCCTRSTRDSMELHFQRLPRVSKPWQSDSKTS